MESHTKHSKLSPKFFFISLGVLVSLISSVSATLVLAFETLDHLYPDILNGMYQYGYSSYNFDSMRSALATLIIVFPVFLVLSYFWTKISRTDLGSTDETIRRWMIYVILFLAGVVIVVDLVTLVRYFVSGEITIRFILKVLTTLGVAGIIESFYFFELRVTDKTSLRIPYIYGIITSIFILSAICVSFVTMGSPSEQRDLRLDQRRVNDLQSIQSQVINRWQLKETLPSSLVELADPISGFTLPLDPEMEKGFSYEYKKLGDLSFEICATFSRPMPEGIQEYGYGMFAERDIAMSSYPYPGGMRNDSWYHGQGRTCFERTIDPELTPVFEKTSR